MSDAMFTDQPPATERLIARERARLTGLTRSIGAAIDPGEPQLAAAGLICGFDANGAVWAWSYNPYESRLGAAVMWASRAGATQLNLIRPRDAAEGDLGLASLSSTLSIPCAVFQADGVELVDLSEDDVAKIVAGAEPLRPVDWPTWRDSLQGRAHQAALVLDGIVERHNAALTNPRAELVWGPGSGGNPALWCWGVELVAVSAAPHDDGLLLDVGVGEHDRDARRELLGQFALGPEHTLAVEAELGDLAELVAELRPLSGSHPLSRLRLETRLLDEVRRSGAIDGRPLPGRFEWLPSARPGRGLLERGAAFAQAGPDLLIGTAGGDLEVMTDVAMGWVRFRAGGPAEPRVHVLVAKSDAHGFLTQGLALLAPAVPVTLEVIGLVDRDLASVDADKDTAGDAAESSVASGSKATG